MNYLTGNQNKYSLAQELFILACAISNAVAQDLGTSLAYPSPWQ